MRNPQPSLAARYMSLGVQKDESVAFLPRCFPTCFPNLRDIIMIHLIAIANLLMFHYALYKLITIPVRPK